MIDPLSALSVAAAAVQFVDYGTRVLKRAQELSNRGSLATNDEMEEMTGEILALSERAKSQSKPTEGLSPSEEAVNVCASSCVTVAEELIALLRDLKPGGSRNILKSLKYANKAVQQSNKIKKLREKLNQFEKHLSGQILQVLNERSSRVSLQLEEIADSNKAVHTHVADTLAEMKSDICQFLQEQHTDYGTINSLLQEMAEAGPKVAVQQRILKSLRFDSMRSRQERIVRAHTDTYSWIFTTDADHPETKFAEWLEKGQGIFWISGKAGSGKSTLMKRLCESPHTKQRLWRWVDSSTEGSDRNSGRSSYGDDDQDQLVVASHFFWSTGTAMQKSQEGLIQTLLYEVLRRRPDLIETVCQWRWREFARWDSVRERWSLADLADAIDLLRHRTSSTVGDKMKFCFFIDGLDEYKGEHKDIIKIVRELAASDSIKICVSSRPWNVFDDAFGGSEQMLVLQEHTRSDIKKYVKDVLEEHPRFKAMQKHGEQHLELVQELTEKAKGVFLWVFLVVKELLKSVENDDNIRDLRRRLQSLPSDLEEYFQLIFHSIDPFYQKQTSQILQLCVRAQAPLPVVAFSIFDHEDPDYAIKAEIEDADYYETLAMQARLRRRLSGRCKDLIEVTHDETRPYDEALTVDFIHSTVKDFLTNEHMRQVLSDRAGPEFDALSMLCRAYLIAIKKFPFYSVTPYKVAINNEGTLKISDLIKMALNYARDMEIEQSHSEGHFLLELERAVSVGLDRPASWWVRKVEAWKMSPIFSGITRDYMPNSFLSLCMIHGPTKYAGERALSCPTIFYGSRNSIALLHTHLYYNRRSEKVLVSLLLDKTLPPDVVAVDDSIWAEFVRWLHCLPPLTLDLRDQLFKHIDRIIRAGRVANKQITLKYDPHEDPNQEPEREDVLPSSAETYLPWRGTNSHEITEIITTDREVLEFHFGKDRIETLLGLRSETSETEASWVTAPTEILDEADGHFVDTENYVQGRSTNGLSTAAKASVPGHKLQSRIDTQLALRSKIPLEDRVQRWVHGSDTYGVPPVP
ncbi:MAG: hypothetical protein M1820_009643 [Bogoriella megaspora]|nr:MAG: hypothetical protein M1820_009643 [Bogoriella megaspora]